MWAMRLASSIPATITEELLPKPRAKGMSELIRIFKGFMFGANFNATRKSKLVSSVGISEPSSWMISHVSFSFKGSAIQPAGSWQKPLVMNQMDTSMQ